MKNVRSKFILFSVYLLTLTFLVIGCGTLSSEEKKSTIQSSSADLASSITDEQPITRKEFIANESTDSLTTDSCGCPPEGNAKLEHVRELNKFKNRAFFPDSSDFNFSITLSKLLQPGDDTKRWSNNQAARIKGYVWDVKPGGMETVNCKAKDKAMRDTHIELVMNPMKTDKKDIMVVEITPRIRHIMHQRGEDWSTKAIRTRFLGRWVEVEGWMMLDVEHTAQAENTNPGRPRNWRGTAWELHPITSIKESTRY
jgi:hypothetical protein